MLIKPGLPPHLGGSAHLSLVPAYKPLSCRQRPSTKTVRVQTKKASSALQDCFEVTDWGIFAKGTDLEGHTSAVLSYINFCAESVSVTKTVN